MMNDPMMEFSNIKNAEARHFSKCQIPHLKSFIHCRKLTTKENPKPDKKKIKR